MRHASSFLPFSFSLLFSFILFSTPVFAATAFNTSSRFDSTATDLPHRLSQTGLYADIRQKTIAASLLPFTPQYPLWSDGALKRRWIYLPPGVRIDTRDMNQWLFPVGTRAWKEFSFRLPGEAKPRRIETRLIEKVAPGQWQFATYLWNEDETEARLVPEEGIKNAIEIARGVAYDIPNRRMCVACHGALQGREGLAGFDALQLSPLRDPNALHREVNGGGYGGRGGDSAIQPGLTLVTLAKLGKITHRPRVWPRILPSELEPLRTQVLGYFHGNCASCHRPDGAAAASGLFLKYDVNSRRIEDTPIYQTAMGVRTSRFEIPNVPAGMTYRIRPGDPKRSAIFYRMVSHEHRMPPLATKVLDREAARAVYDYIKGIP